MSRTKEAICDELRDTIGDYYNIAYREGCAAEDREEHDDELDKADAVWDSICMLIEELARD